MVTKHVYQIPVNDLKTIRLVIKGVATEIQLDKKMLGQFLDQEIRANRIANGAPASIEALAVSLVDVQRFTNADMSIEFVIPCDEDAQ